MDDKIILVFVLGLTVGSAFIAASYQNKHHIDRTFFLKLLGNFFAHGIVILIGTAIIYGLASAVHTLAIWLLTK
jgi:hypothetical protein